MNRPEMPVMVIIGYTEYRASKLLHSGSRGWEYLLSSIIKNEKNCRVCHAPTRRIRSAYTSGEKIYYYWKGLQNGKAI